MIIEYHRPSTLEEALHLLSRKEPHTLPLGGGTILNRPTDDEFAVVDLQTLGLDKIVRRGQSLSIGATVRLQNLVEQPDLDRNLIICLQHEATYNLRQMRTLAGTIVASDGRSPLVTALLALDSHLKIDPGGEEISLGNLLPARAVKLSNRLILQIRIPLNVKLAYNYVARTPADLPIVCTVAAQWPSGRTRIILGGFGQAPVLALDGPDSNGAEEAARNRYNQAGDQWASAEYRSEIAAILTRRSVDDLAIET
jgi:CO/xanthine dehydrogenase FAD-binding subunit